MADKLKFGFYWGAACGGCEIAVLDTNERLLDIIARAEILFWPVALDTKYDDVRAMPDRFLDVVFFNGAVRNSEQKELAELLRRKSKTLVAFGSCAHLGGVPGLANLHNRQEVFATAYHNEPSLDESAGTEPKTRFRVKEGELTLPAFFDQVFPLDRVVAVDYYLPGCPPPVPLILSAVTAIFDGKLPEKGTVLAPVRALCDECPRNQHVAKKLSEIKRTWEIQADPQKCFLEQGIICLGPATRAGCQSRCINGNWPCTGCLGPAPEVNDQGAKMISTIGSILKLEGENLLSEAETERLLDHIVDPVGTFYMYGLARGLINRRRGK